MVALQHSRPLWVKIPPPHLHSPGQKKADPKVGFLICCCCLKTLLLSVLAPVSQRKPPVKEVFAPLRGHSFQKVRNQSPQKSAKFSRPETLFVFLCLFAAIHIGSP